MSWKSLVTIPSVATLLVGIGALTFYSEQSRKRQKAMESPLLSLDTKGQIAALEECYPRLTQEIIGEIAKECDLPATSVQRLRHMFDYNILGGKYFRATLVTNTLQALCKFRKLSIEQYWERALVLGWCVEILQAMFLVADDMMDTSTTRRGKPCWYLCEDVQSDAINDTIILESLMYSLINKHFSNHPNYAEIVKLYQNVSLATEMGQMLDLSSQPQGRKDVAVLHTFDLAMYNRIVTYKTALYTFYLPIAAGMLLVGINGEKDLAVAKTISIELGKKFQIEDDYLDCYGDPAVIGKIGTDIHDFKCSWLIVQALKQANNSPNKDRILKDLEENYGKNEEKIKEVYRELNLEAVYEAQENQSYEHITKLIEEHSESLPPQMFVNILKTMHKRQK